MRLLSLVAVNVPEDNFLLLFVSRALRCTACIDHETSFFITVNHATVARISNKRAQQNPGNSMKYSLLLLLLLFIFYYFIIFHE